MKALQTKQPSLFTLIIQKQQTVLKEAVETIGITFNDDKREREREGGREGELVYMCIIQFLL